MSKDRHNEGLMNDSLLLDYAWHSCVHGRTLILGILFLKLE